MEEEIRMNEDVKRHEAIIEQLESINAKLLAIINLVTNEAVSKRIRR